jgi:CheY-like chemotaxis protein
MMVAAAHGLVQTVNDRYAQPHIVVVDDSPEIQSLLQTLLEEKQWIVTGCMDGDSAVACVREQQPDIVLLDLTLRGSKSGWDVVQTLLDDPATAGIRVVLLTGDVRGVQAHAAWLEQHHIPVIPKPFDLDDILEKLDHARAEKARQSGDRDTALISFKSP